MKNISHPPINRILRDSIEINFYDKMKTLFHFSLIPELGNSLLDVWDENLEELFHTIQI